MLTLEEIRELLQDRRLMVVAQRTGLHYNTLLKIRDNTSSPSYEAVKALSDYFTANDTQGA